MYRCTLTYKSKYFIQMKEYFPIGYGCTPDSTNMCHQNQKAFFVRSGHGLLQVGNNSIEIRKGSTVVLPPGSIYSIKTDTMPIECIATISGFETDEIDNIFNTYIEQKHKI